MTFFFLLVPTYSLFIHQLKYQHTSSVSRQLDLHCINYFELNTIFVAGILYIIQRFISQHYGVDLSAAPEETNAGQGGVGDNGDDCDDSSIAVRRRSLSLREAIDELTQLRVVRCIIISKCCVYSHSVISMYGGRGA